MFRKIHFLGVWVLLSFTVSSTLAATSEFPISRLQGSFGYQNNYSVPTIRRAETVDVKTPSGEERVKALRDDGYTCIRKSLVKRLCSKTWAPEAPPAGVEEAITNFMKPIVIEFSGGTNPPDLIHEGSTTQEWQVNEDVRVINNKLTVYRVVKTNKQQVYIVFPVSESQPLSPLLYHNAETLSLTVIANTKDTPTSTLAYTIVALLEKRR